MRETTGPPSLSALRTSGLAPAAPWVLLRSPDMTYVVGTTLALVGIIHLLPLTGVVGGDRLDALYGVPIDDPNLAILMRHRAVLFGLLGAFMVYAAFTPAVRTLALLAGFVSVISFLVLAWTVGGYNAEIGRVVTVDLVALLLLVAGAAAHGYLTSRGAL